MTFVENREFQCRVFSPDNVELSVGELKKLLKDLLEKFPHTVDKSGNRTPYDPNMPDSIVWFKCYDHIITLISIKRDESKNNRTFWISIVAILVSLASAIAQLSPHAN